jgi:hypothetical protein
MINLTFISCNKGLIPHATMALVVKIFNFGVMVFVLTVNETVKAAEPAYAPAPPPH